MIRVCPFLLLLFVCIVYETYSANAPYHFRCGDGRYIHDTWFCDGSFECQDHSDETYGCDKNVCGRGKFQCTDKTCMNVSVHCNGLNDCSDGSDEVNCGDEIDIEDCPSLDGSFLCEDKSKCIDFEHICDGYCNCVDCSDEKTGCLQYANYLCDKCSDTCYITPNDTNKFTRAPSQQIYLTPCQGCKYWFSCEQRKCLTMEIGKELCVCDENYEIKGLDNYGKEICESKVLYENVIIYSTPNEVKLFNLTTNQTIILKDEVNCTALAAAHDHVFYATLTTSGFGIFKMSISSKERQQVLVTDSRIFSIAIDWITKNIYYTTASWIIVCSSDGQTCTKLRSCSECRVKLLPKVGLMFWSEYHVLFQSDMDGSNERNFSYLYSRYRYADLNGSRLLFSMDESTDTIFWSDNPPFMKRARLYLDDSLDELLMYSVHRKDWFDLDVFESLIYLTIENETSIYYYDISTNRYAARVNDTNATFIKNIQVYNRLLQCTKIPNPCLKSSCSLCLLKPFSPLIGLNYMCKCQNFNSTHDQIDCNDETPEKSKTTPDATARKRDIYDVNNPPFSWKEFLLKIKTIIIIFLISLSVGVYFGARKWYKLKKCKKVNVTRDPNSDL